MRTNPRQAHRILLVGVGPLARALADDLRATVGIDLLGAVPLPGETPHVALDLPLLDGIEALPAWLESIYVDELYLAADIATQRGPMQTVIALCERIGIPFAIPGPLATGFCITRSTPRNLPPGA